MLKTFVVKHKHIWRLFVTFPFLPKQCFEAVFFVSVHKLVDHETYITLRNMYPSSLGSA